MNETSKKRFESLFNNLELGQDGVWSSNLPDSDQKAEVRLREKVANVKVDNYLDSVAKHHSIPVMDHEVKRYLDLMPSGSIILDIGGCWGWHWRNIKNLRPDVYIIIVDFVRSNLHHAKNVLGSLIGEQAELVHADATALPFPNEVIDGVWTVQTFQHIPSYIIAFHESYRVLKKDGRFINYSLHITPVIRFIYKALGKQYHIDGEIKESFYLTRANNKQKDELANIFTGEIYDKFSECLFHPELKLTFTGKERSWIGKLDYYLGNYSIISNMIARQRSLKLLRLEKAHMRNHACNLST